MMRYTARDCSAVRQLWDIRCDVSIQDRLAARGESPALHRGLRCARLARRDEREYREYLSEEQRSQPGCSAGRMPRDFRRGLPAWPPRRRANEGGAYGFGGRRRDDSVPLPWHRSSNAET